MARRNVKVDVPRNDPDKLIALVEKLDEHSTAEGAASPLKDEAYMAPMVANAARAKQLRKEAASLREQAEAKNGEANKLLGLAAGQTLTTEGTVLYHVTQAKSRLLDRNRGKEQNLEPYGYRVVISESTPGRRRPAE